MRDTFVAGRKALGSSREDLHTEVMTDVPRSPSLEPDTPWEFLTDDDDRVDEAPTAEEAAMHVEKRRWSWSDVPPGRGTPTVHYLEDEDPEIPDRSETTRRRDETEPVDELLKRQHYTERD